MVVQVVRYIHQHRKSVLQSLVPKVNRSQSGANRRLGSGLPESLLTLESQVNLILVNEIYFLGWS